MLVLRLFAFDYSSETRWQRPDRLLYCDAWCESDEQFLNKLESMGECVLMSRAAASLKMRAVLGQHDDMTEQR